MSTNLNGSEAGVEDGLDVPRAALSKLLASNSGAQAVLICGGGGPSRSVLAEWISRAWHCPTLGGVRACEECASCRTFERGSSPDMHRISPRGLSRVIKLNAIVRLKRDPDPDPPYPLTEFLRTPPLAAGNKIVSIEESERLSQAAANSLLKILEEPPPYARYVLFADSPGSLLSTLVSRCLVYSCPDVARDGAESPDELEEGNLSRRVFEEIAEKLVSAGPAGCLALADQIREACDQLVEEETLGKRAAHVEAMRHFAASLVKFGASPASVHDAIEAHRRLLGNASAPLTFDALFAGIAVRESSPAASKPGENRGRHA